MQVVDALEIWLSWQFEQDSVVVADSSFSQEVGGLQLVWVVMIETNSSDVMMMNLSDVMMMNSSDVKVMNLSAALSPSCL